MADVALFGIVAPRAYGRLAYRSLALRRGDVLDPLTYEVDFVRKDADVRRSPISVGSSAVIAAVYPAHTETAGSCWTDWRVVPLRKGSVLEVDAPRGGDETYRVQLGRTIRYHALTCIEQRSVRLVDALALSREDLATAAHGGIDLGQPTNRASRLKVRSVEPDHPYLVASITRETMRSALECATCEEVDAMSHSDWDDDYRDAYVWEQTSRHLTDLIERHALSFTNFSEAFVRIVGIERKGFVHRDPEQDLRPQEALAGPMRRWQIIRPGAPAPGDPVTTTPLTRRGHHRLVLRSRLGRIEGARVDLMQAEVVAPPNLVRPENRLLRLTRGTLNHVISIDALDRPGHGNIVVRVSPAGDARQREELQYDLVIPAVVPFWRPRSNILVGSLFLVIGFVLSVLAALNVFDAKKTQLLGLTHQGVAGAFAFVLLGLGAAFLSYRTSE